MSRVMSLANPDVSLIYDMMTFFLQNTKQEKEVEEREVVRCVGKSNISGKGGHVVILSPFKETSGFAA